MTEAEKREKALAIMNSLQNQSYIPWQATLCPG